MGLVGRFAWSPRPRLCTPAAGWRPAST